MAGVAMDWWPPKWPGVIYQLLQCCSHLPTAVLRLTLRSFYWHRRQQCCLKTYLPSQKFLWVVKKTGKIRTKAHNEENLVTKTKNRRKTSTNNINGQKMSYSTMTVQIMTAKVEQCCHWVVSCRMKGKRHWCHCHQQWSAACDCGLYLRVCAWRGAS